MIHFSKNPPLCYTYINIFYNICVGTVGILPAVNLKKTVNQDDLCRTLTNRVHTAMAAIALMAALPHLLLKQHSPAGTSPATSLQYIFAQFWPGIGMFPTGPLWYLADQQDNYLLSMYPMYACSKGNGTPLPCYFYA